jgi:hypothetical protein
MDGFEWLSHVVLLLSLVALVLAIKSGPLEIDIAPSRTDRRNSRQTQKIGALYPLVTVRPWPFSAKIVSLFDPLVSAFRLVQQSGEQCTKLFFHLKAGEIEGAQLAARLCHRVPQVDLDVFKSVFKTRVLLGDAGRTVRRAS